jgi:hypothetical protein
MRHVISGIKRTCAIDAEDDENIKKLRIAKYDKEREMLLKLAETTDGEKVLESYQYQGRRLNDDNIEFFFDLRKNLDEEGFPGTVVNILRTCMLS